MQDKKINKIREGEFYPELIILGYSENTPNLSNINGTTVYRWQDIDQKIIEYMPVDVMQKIKLESRSVNLSNFSSLPGDNS